MFEVTDRALQVADSVVKVDAALIGNNSASTKTTVLSDQIIEL